MMWFGYITLLCVAAAAALSSGPWILVGAGLTIIWMWCVAEVAYLLGYQPPALVYLVMDIGACVGFWHFGARIFAATFAVQIVIHLAYLAGAVELWPYWYIHTASAYVQLFVLIGWEISARKEMVE